MSNSYSALQRIQHAAEVVGMQINASYTKVRSVGFEPTEKSPVINRSSEPEDVDFFNYLVLTILPDGQETVEIHHCLSLAWSTLTSSTLFVVMLNNQSGYEGQNPSVTDSHYTTVWLWHLTRACVGPTPSGCLRQLFSASITSSKSNLTICVMY